MNSNASRWMQMIRFTEAQIGAIHTAERNADLIWKEKTMSGKRPTGSYWREAGLPLFVDFNYPLGPFWQKSKPEEERAIEVERFCRSIYPIWAPILNGQEDELVALHKADWEIFRNAPKINTKANTFKNPEISRLFGQHRTQEEEQP